MRVLIALDGSECSQRALEFALKMPWKLDTQFCLFTAIYLWEDDFNISQSSYEKATDKAKEIALKLLEEKTKYFKEKLPENHIEIDYTFDKAREAIVEKAFDYKADLIIMGSHGRSGFNKLLMGSVAEYVTNVAPCAVQVVKGTHLEASAKTKAKSA